MGVPPPLSGWRLVRCVTSNHAKHGEVVKGGGGGIRDRGLIYFDFTKGALFWDYSGIGILGIDGICILLAIIPFSE